MKKVNLYDAIKGKYGSDAEYKLVTGIRNKVDDLKKILEEIENFYKKETFMIAHPLVDLETGKTYSSSETYLVPKDIGLKNLRALFEQILSSYKGESISIEVDAKGLKNLRNILGLNYGKDMYKLLDRLINNLF